MKLTIYYDKYIITIIYGHRLNGLPWENKTLSELW